MNHISPLKKSVAAIALVLGITPMGAYALLADAKMAAHFPLDVKDNPATGQTPDAMKKCVGTLVGSTVTFGPTGEGGASPSPESFYEPIPNEYMQFPRATKVAMFPGVDGSHIQVVDKTPATCTGIAAMDIAPAFSISAWVKTDNDAPTGASIIDRGTSWSLTTGPLVDTDPDTNFTYNVHPVNFCMTGPGTTLASGAALATPGTITKCLTANMGINNNAAPGDGRWHNIIVTYTKAPPLVNGVSQPQAIMYIDGIKVAISEAPNPLKKHTAPFPQPALGSTSTRIGNKFKGYIDDVRFYNAALTPDDITELAQGCRPATFDPKTGKVSIPCVVEIGDDMVLGAWTADLMALPPIKPTGSGYLAVTNEVGRNLIFNVAAAKPIPVPVGAPPALPTGYALTGTPLFLPGGAGAFAEDALFRASEYPWGPFVAQYAVTMANLPVVYDWIDEIDDVGIFKCGESTYCGLSLFLPAVTAPSPLGLPVKECYTAHMFYNLVDNRFYMNYGQVRYMGPNCLGGEPS
jgi:hypothetical protein